MKDIIRNQRGVMSILISILAAAILLAVGWAVYSHRTQTSILFPEKTPKASITPAATPQTYLKIAELGIKIQLPDEIKDIVYSFDPAHPQRIGLSTGALQKADPDCSASAEPLGTIGKTADPNQPIGVLSPNGETVFKFDGNYVFYQTPQAACTSNQATLNMAIRQQKAFQEAFKTVQPIK